MTKLKQLYARLTASRAGAVCVAAALLAFLILVNLLVSLLPYTVTKNDMTGVGLYSLSGISKSYLKSLDEDIIIYCLTENGAESRALATLFSRYQSETDRIHIQYVDIDNDPAFCQKYGIETSSVTDSSLVIESAKRYLYLDYRDLCYYYSEAAGIVSQAEYEYMYTIYSKQGASNFLALYGFNFSDLQVFYDGEGKITNAVEYVLRDSLAYDLTLSDNTLRFLGTITEPVTISCVWKGERSECQLTGILDQYATANQNITVHYIDPEQSENAAFIEKHFTATPETLTLVVESERRSTIVSWSDVVLYHHARLGTLTSSQYASYLAMENQLYSSFQQAFPYGYCYSYYLAYTQGATSQASLFNLTDVTTYYDLEEVYTNAIDYVTQKTIPHAYILTGDLGTPLSSKLLDFFADAGTDYELLDPTTVEAIPEDAASLLLYAPLRDLTDGETARIGEYLKGGGHLLLFTNAENTTYPNLMGVLSEYGVTAGANTVRDSGSNAFFGTEEHLLPTISSSHNINYYPSAVGYRVDMPGAHLLSVAKNADLPENVTVTNILTTSSSGYITYQKVNEDGSTEQVTEKATYPLAVDIQNSKTGATIVWYASTEMLSDSLILTTEEEKAADETGKDSDLICGNKYYAALAVSYLGKSFTPTHTTVKPIAAELVDGNCYDISAVKTSYEPLDTTASDLIWILVGILTVIVIPGAILAIGIILHVRRRKA